MDASAYAHGSIGSAGLTHAKRADLDADSAWPHLRFLVEAQNTDVTPARGKSGAQVATRYVILVAYLIRTGTANGGELDDLDNASALAEDIAVALDDDDADFSVALVSIGVSSPGDGNNSMIRVELDAFHNLGA